jgi:hypothetical protein
MFIRITEVRGRAVPKCCQGLETEDQYGIEAAVLGAEGFSKNPT